MAKFFKNYNKINLDIFKKVKNCLTDEEFDQLNIEPKYLGMSHMKHCDFCNNSDDNYTTVDEITIMFGYQICNKCKERDIGKTFKNNWFIENKILTSNYFIDKLDESHLFKKDCTYRIQRSNGCFEDGWFLDSFDLIKYVIREDNTEDLLLPFYKSSIETRSLHKTIYLSELCRFNSTLHENNIMLKFKSLLEDFSNNI